MITWAQRAASPSRFFEKWDPVPCWKRQDSRFLDSVGWFASSPSCSTRTDSSKKSLITGRSSGAPIPYRHETPIYFTRCVYRSTRDNTILVADRVWRVLPVGTGRCPRNIEWLRQPLGFESLALRGHSITADSA